jgi:cytochrome P450
MTVPANLIAAATHPDPYPSYEALVAGRPIAFDHGLGMWVAASAEAVQAVLTDPRCRVRPLHEPVPEALRWTAGDDIYRRLVRQNDGPEHARLKQAVSAALASLDPHDVERQVRGWATRLLETRPILMGLPFLLPAHVIGSLLGIKDLYLPNTAIFVDHVVTWFAGGRGSETEALGDLAATDLRMTLNGSLQDAERDGRVTLLTELAGQMRAVDITDSETIVANGIGFFVQAYDATAGLMGNALVALARDPQLRLRLTTDPGLIEQCIVTTAVADPAVQNTRRYVAEDGLVAGQHMQAGDVILVLLAAANRDPVVPLRAAPEPRFRFSFGTGPHACPGAGLALTIARAGIEALLVSGDSPWPEQETVTYRRSINARVPRFTEENP